MNSYTPAVLKLLKEAECVFVRHGRGDHDIWESPITGARFPVDHEIKSRHTANGILKRAGLRKGF
jgi:HicA toxin of bacterial toxin-antitoxin,